MTDSIPHLRRIINDQAAKIRNLESELVVEKEVVKYVDRVVEIHVPSEPVVNTVVETVYVPLPGERVVEEVERIVYVDNPEHIAMIRKLQKCLSISQSDL